MSAEKGQTKVKNFIKKTGALCCALALVSLMLLPTLTSYAAMGARNSRLLPDGIEYPMRRAVREGSEALDDMMPKPENGTVNDDTQGASDGMLDGAGESGAPSETASGALTGDQTNDEGAKSNMTAVAIVIAVLAAVAIIVLIFIAIPKSKSKPGGTHKGDR